MRYTMKKLMSLALCAGLLCVSALAAGHGQGTGGPLWRYPADGSIPTWPETVQCDCPGVCLPAGIMITVHHGSDRQEERECCEHIHAEDLYPYAIEGQQGQWPGWFFFDVPVDQYYARPVMWAVVKGITTGTQDGNIFSPDKTCTRGEILTMLHRAKGCPEAGENRFADMGEEMFYCRAANWAYECGMVSGDVFAGETPCTRMDVVRYLWQLAGSPAGAQKAGFTDLPTDADGAAAVAWAVEQGITTGTGDGTTFSPERTCTRSEIVTFLYRAYGQGE